MLTIKTVLIAATQKLTKTSPSARLDAELLLSFVLKLPKIKLFAEWNRELTNAEWQAFDELVVRRSHFEPVAYLTGVKEFYGLEFLVSPQVLIPRPDTEILVEEALKLISDRKKVRLLDLGTGSGCLVISLVKEMQSRDQEVEAVALDKSVAALEIAKQNALKLQVQNIEFLESDWFEKASGKFDLIVANPPYIAVDDKELSKETKFEPQTALFSGQDGLDDINKIFLQLNKYLAPKAFFVCETGAAQHSKIREFLQNQNLNQYFSEFFSFNDLAGQERVVAVRAN